MATSRVQKLSTWCPRSNWRAVLKCRRILLLRALQKLLLACNLNLISSNARSRCKKLLLLQNLWVLLQQTHFAVKTPGSLWWLGCPFETASRRLIELPSLGRPDPADPGCTQKPRWQRASMSEFALRQVMAGDSRWWQVVKSWSRFRFVSSLASRTYSDSSKCWAFWMILSAGPSAFSSFHWVLLYSCSWSSLKQLVLGFLDLLSLVFDYCTEDIEGPEQATLRGALWETLQFVKMISS